MAREQRPPIIAVMGHIDHGKSSLLDYIRKANVVANETGGITQHVSAYVAVHSGRPVTFLDTPGHEAFKAIRARGANIADIAILVVASDEGFMPQTLDALNAIKEADIPYIVAITKIDKNNSDIEHTKNSLLENGIFLEGLGGDISYSLISSKTGEGIPELLDLVLLSADLADLNADYKKSAEGFVLESTQDSKRGASATLIVKDGTLTKEGFVVAGDAYAPIRFIENFLGERVESIKASEPARISGFNKLPNAGTSFIVVKDKKDAEILANKNTVSACRNTNREDLQNGFIELPIIIKTDVAGSIDAINHELDKINVDRGTICIISSGVGSVSEGDIKTAYASSGVVIAFNVSTDSIARDLADRDNVNIFSFSIIYELSEKVKELLKEKVPSIDSEIENGRAKVLKQFSSNAKKQVAGARHISGTLKKGDRIKVMRGGEELSRGSIINLQQAKSDISEIKVEGDFGIEIELKEPLQYSDEIISFTITKI